jgi:hypothetical protein
LGVGGGLLVIALIFLGLFAKQKKQEEVSEQVESRDIVREGLYEQH